MTQTFSLAELTDNLVPFSARKVTSSVIWHSPDVDDAVAMQNACSYLTDTGSSNSTKIFLAERYGGSGIQRNGGGSRCGFDGRYQIKGIGVNPLVGEGTDRGHSSGVLTASDAIYEALWSEVLAQILPYGAVRTRGVLLTENHIVVNSKHSSRRALLVRDPVVRPAHFQRAPYFQALPQYAEHLIHDAQRVKSVIRLLPETLPAPPAGFSEEAYRDRELYCIEGLCELARRQAMQMGFCRTRFLRMTTSPSNTAMDGRLLDFNGLSSLFPGDHLYDFGYRLRLTELMKEPAILQEGLSDLCLYLGKYLFSPMFTRISRQQVQESFHSSFEVACCHGYLEMLGIPANILSLKDIPETLKQLVNSFMKLLSNRCRTLYSPPNNVGKEPPLERLIVTLIRRSKGLMIPDSEDLEHDVHFLEMLRCFTSVISWLFEVCQTQGIDASVILNRMEPLARQRLQSRECLGKARIFEEIGCLLDTHGNDALSLQTAFSEIGTRMQTFAVGALGCHSTLKYAVNED